MVARGLLLGTLVLAGCDRDRAAPAPAATTMQGAGTAGSAAVAAVQGAGSAGSAAGSSPRRAARATAVDPPAAAGATAPNLVAAGDAVLATWLEPATGGAGAGAGGASAGAGAGGASHRLRFARLASGGWERPATIAEAARIVASSADVPSVARQGDGALVAHWAEQPATGQGEGYDVVLARSVDGGATWRRLGTPHPGGVAAEHGFVSLVPDGNAVLALWLDGRAAGGPAGATALRVARVGAAIGQEQVVDERVCDCCSTSAVPTAAGPVVVVAFSGDGGATFEPPIEVDAPRGARAPLGRVDVVIDRPGEALVSWIAAEREDGRLLVRRIARDRRRGAELEIAAVATSRATGAPRMERLGEDAMLAWTDAQARAIRAVRVPLGDVPAAELERAPAPAP